MKSLSLRLFLLVCVATMLRADVCLAQDIRGDNLRSSIGASRKHLEAHFEAADRAQVPRVMAACKTDAPASFLEDLLPGHAPAQARYAALGKHALFKARSTLEPAGR